MGLAMPNLAPASNPESTIFAHSPARTVLYLLALLRIKNASSRSSGREEEEDAAAVTIVVIVVRRGCRGATLAVAVAGAFVGGATKANAAASPVEARCNAAAVATAEAAAIVAVARRHIAFGGRA